MQNVREYSNDELVALVPLPADDANKYTRGRLVVVAGSALAVLVDFETGYRCGGVSFVVPAFICAGIVAVVVLVMCNRTNWAGYVLYQAVLAVFGLAMPVLYFTGLAHSLVGAVVPSILAVATLAGMAVFGDRTIKNEFRRRLQF